MDNGVEDITGVVVSYNSKNLLKVCLESIRKFYPNLKIIIIDGSQPDNTCYEYVKQIDDEHISPVTIGYNIGHGVGMNKGIEMAESDYVLLFDSDIIMNSPPIEKMLEVFDHNTFGVGLLMMVNKNGVNVSSDDDNAIPYLHPYFQIINRENYQKYKPYAHHGAPCILTMMDIYKRGLSKKILKPFPVENYIHHEWRGTRRMNPEEFTQNWISIDSPKGFKGFVKKYRPWNKK